MQYAFCTQKAHGVKKMYQLALNRPTSQSVGLKEVLR